MLNTLSRLWLVIGVWLMALAAIMAGTMAMEASALTSALLLITCSVPMGLLMILRWGAPPPTVAEVLHAVDNQNDYR
jgi:hypothetical protein